MFPSAVGRSTTLGISRACQRGGGMPQFDAPSHRSRDREPRAPSASRRGLSLQPFHGEQPPLTGHSAEGVNTTILEAEPRSRNEIPHRAGDQHLAASAVIPPRYERRCPRASCRSSRTRPCANSPRGAARSDPAASITARTSSMRCSRVGQLGARDAIGQTCAALVEEDQPSKRRQAP